VHRHRIFRVIGRFFPDRLIYLIHGIYAAGVLHQQLQYSELRRSNCYHLPIDGNSLLFIIYRKSPCFVNPVFLLHASKVHVSPQLRSDPGNELQGIERLGYVVIGSDVKACDLVVVLRLGRKHDDRDVLFLSDAHGRLHAVQLRHHYVHNDKMYLPAVHYAQRFDAVIGLEYLVPLVPQVYLDGPCYLSVIITNKYVHSVPLSRLQILY